MANQSCIVRRQIYRLKCETIVHLYRTGSSSIRSASEPNVLLTETEVERPGTDLDVHQYTYLFPPLVMSLTPMMGDEHPRYSMVRVSGSFDALRILFHTIRIGRGLFGRHYARHILRDIPSPMPDASVSSRRMIGLCNEQGSRPPMFGNNGEFFKVISPRPIMLRGRMMPRPSSGASSGIHR